MRKVILNTAILFIFLACEPTLEFENEGYESKLVIDGYIEQGQFPKVTLTLSSGFLDDVDSVSIRKLIEPTAKITISDGAATEVLTLQRNENNFPPLVYEGTDIRGEIGKTYTLQVQKSGRTYRASTSIPSPPPRFDSLWFEKDLNDSNKGTLFGEFTDNGAEANNYRVFTRRKNKDNAYIPVYLSTVDDKFFNGKSFKFSLLRGDESLTADQGDQFFDVGDTVDVRFCSLDEAHFEFWRTLEREQYLTGNPFASAGNEIKSNIQGGALGVWGGYGAVYQRIIIKE